MHLICVAEVIQYLLKNKSPDNNRGFAKIKLNIKNQMSMLHANPQKDIFHLSSTLHNVRQNLS